MATLVSINVSIRVLCFKDELSALRGGRKRLGFGYSTEDIDEAMKEIADIEAELLEDMYGVEINYAESMESLNKQIVCPVCQVDSVEETGSGVVRCRSKVRFYLHGRNIF